MLLDNRNKNEHNKTNGVGIIKAGIFGALVGAVATAAVMLTDTEIRKITQKKADKMGKTLSKAGMKTIKNLQGTSEHAQDDINRNLTDMKNRQKDIVDETKSKISKTI